MKSFTVLFFVLVAGFFVFLYPVSAVAQSPCPNGWESLCRITVQNKPNLVATIVQFLIVIAIIVSVIFLIWGGIRWIMSGGDKAKVEQARSAIMAAIIGLVISLLAFFIIGLVMYFITGNANLNGIKIPRLID